MELCYINGEFVAPEHAMLPVSDLIIQRGVGVFEAFGTIDARPLMMTPHLERLLQSASQASIHPEYSFTHGVDTAPDMLIPDWREIFVERIGDIIREGIARVRLGVKEFHAKHEVPEVSVKVYLTGGDVFDERQGFIAPRLLVIFEKLALPPRVAYEQGVMLEPLPFGRDNPSVKSVDYKVTYTTSEAAFEVLYCPNGEITEAGHSSFFLVMPFVSDMSSHESNKLITAPLPRVLAGTTRRAILELAHGAQIPVEERCPLVAELTQATEAFITGSTKQVVPVTRIGDTIIGDGRPGPVTKRLAELYRAHIQAWLE